MKHFELLPPNLWLEDLKNWRTQLKHALHELEKQITAAKTSTPPRPAGHLRIAATKHGPQYYHITKRGDTAGTYIPKNQQKLISQLAQQTYDHKTVAALQLQLHLIDKFLQRYQAADTQTQFTKLEKERRQLITPITLENETYAQQWQTISYVGKSIPPETPSHLTIRGEKVRSKSEVIIADILARNNIPYRYEYPVKLKNYTVHPDFYCLNLSTRREYLWEHLGMMDDPVYSANAVRKILDYQTCGYFLGINLIITVETDTLPFSQKQASRVIEAYLK